MSDDCDNVIERLFEYLDSEMTADDAEKMRTHVAECSPCLAELGIDEMVKRLLRRSCVEQAPEYLRLRIHEQIVLYSADGSPRES
ncbi:mycothiol system anti-sigma-R factor [Sanguibacter antarcticus]|uniref:Mycothiol system anti-sigma-R factor n=1 Tax=Sanguibacter antarcticus TaxID=372484 RepID=A0A2A9E0L4_9MICO|nr:mycothiol system anti-sigma-R factor [Sanguibacter antarcticus]PFG32587.1 mycothiol system anti-sigma-R factor [Sanguibacter antarcticus]